MIKFTKMHGIGNSYIYINCFEEEVFNPSKMSEFVQTRTSELEADREFSVDFTVGNC